MKGLLKNNLYAALSNLKTFFVVLSVSGIFVAAVISQPLLFGYVMLCMVGCPLISLTGLSKENSSKWSKYKLTAPVRRIDIIKSYFSSQLIWLAAGAMMALAVTGLSVMLHGSPFDRKLDFLMLMTMGVSVSLFMSAIFFPLHYIGDGEKSEALLMISLFGAAGILTGISSLINWYFGENMTELQMLMGIALIIICSGACFLASIPLTAFLFRKKEY